MADPRLPDDPDALREALTDTHAEIMAACLIDLHHGSRDAAARALEGLIEDRSQTEFLLRVADWINRAAPRARDPELPLDRPTPASGTPGPLDDDIPF